MADLTINSLSAPLAVLAGKLHISGHLQEAPWTSASTTIPVTLTAGPAFDPYSISAGVIEGPSGLDPDSVPTFSSFGPIIVV